MIYFIGWALFLIIFKICLKFKVVGRGNIPRKGPFIFASNHVSDLDPILLGVSVRRGLYYMARDSLFEHPLFGWIMRHLHSFPVKRSANDLKAVKEAIRILNEGKPLVIFPEGTRSEYPTIKPAKPGISFIAAKTKVPVVPAYIKGSFDALPRGVSTLRCHPVEVHIGKPVAFDVSSLGSLGKDKYQHMSDTIMHRVAELKEGCGQG